MTNKNNVFDTACILNEIKHSRKSFFLISQHEESFQVRE